MPGADIVLIGHVTRDLLPDGGWRPGGSVVYGAHLAARWGLRPAVLTSAANVEEAAAALPDGTALEFVPSQVTTTFRNVPGVPRRQYITALASPLAAATLPPAWRRLPALAMPVSGELAPNFLDEAGFSNMVGVGLQGWLRTIDSTGEVHAVDARTLDLPRRLFGVTAVFVSEEDLTGTDDPELVLTQIACDGTYVLLTLGERGSELFTPQRHGIPASPARVTDTTGAGDAFATGFMLGLMLGDDPLNAARLSSAAAACSIEGEGISALPSLADARRRRDAAA